MKLPSNVLAKLLLAGAAAGAGCETAASLRPTSAEPVVVEATPVEVETAEPTFAQPPPGAAPRIAPEPAPTPKPTPTPIPKVVRPKVKAAPKHTVNGCGPCGMG